MLLDDALRGTLKNFSTLFLVLFAVIAPLHLVYGFVFQDVLALRELHPAIGRFPPSRQVRGVGRAALDQARLWLWVLVVIEVTLLPLFVRAAAHVVDSDQKGELPTALGAWRRVGTKAEVVRGRANRLGTILAGILLGLAVGFLTEAILMVIADLVPDSAAFAVIALARGAGHAAGGAFALGTFLYSAAVSPETTAEKAPDLY